MGGARSVGLSTHCSAFMWAKGAPLRIMNDLGQGRERGIPAEGTAQVTEATLWTGSRIFPILGLRPGEFCSHWDCQPSMEPQDSGVSRPPHLVHAPGCLLRLR